MTERRGLGGVGVREGSGDTAVQYPVAAFHMLLARGVVIGHTLLPEWQLSVRTG